MTVAKLARAYFFARGVVPVADRNGRTVLDHDEIVRPDTTAEGLTALKPSFAAVGERAGFDAVALQKHHWVERIEHVHHAGSSSGIVDGASLLVVGSEAVGRELGLVPRARVVTRVVTGVVTGEEPTSPAPTSTRCGRGRARRRRRTRARCG